MNTTTVRELLQLGRTLITARAKQALYPYEVLSALWNHAREGRGMSFDPADAKHTSPAEEGRPARVRAFQGQFSSDFKCPFWSPVIPSGFASPCACLQGLIQRRHSRQPAGIRG